MEVVRRLKALPTVDYTYTYDGDRPLTKIGALTFTTGSSAGQRFETRSEFSYY
jgi:hypothetical protein